MRSALRCYESRTRRDAHSAGEAFLPHAEAAIREVGRRGPPRAGEPWRPRHAADRLHQCASEPARARGDQRLSQRLPDLELQLVVQATTRSLRNCRGHDRRGVRPARRRPRASRCARFHCRTSVCGLPFRTAIRWRRGSGLRLDDLRNEPFISTRAPRQPALRLDHRGVQNAGFSPRVVQEAPQMASMVSLVPRVWA